MGKKSKESVMKETEKLLAFDHAIIKVYEEVLNGDRKQFPRYTWELPNSMYYAEVLMRYVFEKKLKWSIDDIKEKFRFETIKKIRLLGMHQALFTNIYDMINLVYPDEIKPWELKKVEKKFWDCDDNKKEALRWLFEEKLQWDIEEIKEKANIYTFHQYGLGCLFMSNFNSNLYQAINFLYPNKIRPWELKKVEKKFWDCDDNKKEALRWLFEEKLQWDIEQIKNEMSEEIFRENGLWTPFVRHFNASFYKTVDFVYPGKIKPWEFKAVPQHYWLSDENKRHALNWLFEEKLQWTLEEIKEKANRSIFNQYGLGSLFAHCFNSSPYQAINFLYPNQIQPWETKGSVHHIWDKKEEKKKALQWLIEEKLQWELKDIDRKMTIQTFKTYKLYGLLKQFNYSPYKAMKFLYPNEEFRNLKAKRKSSSKEESAG